MGPRTITLHKKVGERYIVKGYNPGATLGGFKEMYAVLAFRRCGSPGHWDHPWRQ